MPDESIIERLRAALDQAQHLAEQATPGPWGVANSEVYGIVQLDYFADGSIKYGDDVVEAIGAENDPATAPNAEFIAAWSPARVLRLIASHRQLLEEHTPLSDEPARAWFVGCKVCSYRDRYEELCVEFPCAEVRRVAEFWLGSTE